MKVSLNLITGDLYEQKKLRHGESLSEEPEARSQQEPRREGGDNTMQRESQGTPRIMGRLEYNQPWEEESLAAFETMEQ